jgi:EAL domain-containing protein (putative c-di-GMP-specific phosphodiesterase class I)
MDDLRGLREMARHIGARLPLSEVTDSPFYSPSVATAEYRRAVLRSELKAAIAAGAIVPYYQPAIRLSDGEVVGFEVLARWNHPKRGILLPQDFISLAEDAGLIGDLCLGLLKHAVADASTWSVATRLSINIAPVQFADLRLAEKILAVLADAGFAAHRLTVELTETAVITDLTRTRTTIAKLKRAGVRIAMDDFGNGYSSLVHLRELPFDVVKIDRSFVTARRTSQKSARILSAVISLCKELGLVSVAEGVENEINAQWLREQGCMLAQGFLYARPLPAEDVASYLGDGMPERRRAIA